MKRKSCSDKDETNSTSNSNEAQDTNAVCKVNKYLDSSNKGEGYSYELEKLSNSKNEDEINLTLKMNFNLSELSSVSNGTDNKDIGLDKDGCDNGNNIEVKLDFNVDKLIDELSQDDEETEEDDDLGDLVQEENTTTGENCLVNCCSHNHCYHHSCHCCHSHFKDNLGTIDTETEKNQNIVGMLCEERKPDLTKDHSENNHGLRHHIINLHSLDDHRLGYEDLATIFEDEFEDFDDTVVIDFNNDLKDEYNELVKELSFKFDYANNLTEAHELIIKLLEELKEENIQEVNNNSERVKNQSVNEIDENIYKTAVELENSEEEFYRNDVEDFPLSNLDRINEILSKKDVTLPLNFIIKSTKRTYRLEETSNIKLGENLIKLKSRALERVISLVYDYSPRIFQIRDLCLTNFREFQLYFFEESDFISIRKEFLDNEYIDYDPSYMEISVKTAAVLINVLIYLHSRHILHLNLTLDSIGITNNGLIKIGDLKFINSPSIQNLSEEKIEMMKTTELGKEQQFDYSSDYFLLGQLLLEMFVPDFKFVCYKNFPFSRMKINAKLIPKEFWRNYFFYNPDICRAKQIICRMDQYKDLGKFVGSCFDVSSTRCSSFTKSVIVKSFVSSKTDKILDVELIKTLEIFNGVNFNECSNNFNVVDIQKYFPDIYETIINQNNFLVI